jgi:uncharacterized membrane protein YgcG
MIRLLCTICYLLVFSSAVMADERILSFHSDIHILPDSSMKVSETITVRAEGKNIKRGIYRDFPTSYKDRLGNRYRVDFAVESVKRDGYPEDYHIKAQSNGLRIYFGNKDKLLQRGEYTYSLVYHTNRQLGFFEEHDELYWNVTGNNWVFPIDKASATIHLPGKLSYADIKSEAYTGKLGSKEQRFLLSRPNNGDVHIEAARPLQMKEGLTIVVAWPKGVVAEPTSMQRFSYILKDNRHVLIACIGLLLLSAYYVFVWMKVGKDPEKGVVVAEYQPPEGYSPAAVRYIENMAYDKTCFAAGIINLAVKGFLTIKEAGDEYTLEKTGDIVTLAAGEKALSNKLFRFGKSITLKQSNHSRISDALDAHKASLQRNYEKEYFLTNRLYFILGLVLTLILLITSLLAQPQKSDIAAALFMTVWLTGWSVGVLALTTNAYRLWRNAYSTASVFAALFHTAFAIPFIGGEVMGITMFAGIASWSMVIVLILAVIINGLFYELLKAPTLAGRKLLDKIEGFRRYIDIAERHELDYKHPKGRCPELFETYLPYALAMGIEQKWGEQFADVLVKTQASGGVSYRPGWYQGTHWDHNHIGGFSSSLGSSFTSAIASSSTAPGSSSGGGGGGFSGGGGGGGGGGGW